MKPYQLGSLSDFPVLPFAFMMMNFIFTIAARPTTFQDHAIPSASSANGDQRIRTDTRLAVYTRELELVMQRSPLRSVHANAPAWPSPGQHSESESPPPPNRPLDAVTETEARDLALLSRILHRLLLGTNLYRLIHALATASIASSENLPLHLNDLERAYTSLEESVQTISHVLVRSGRDQPATDSRPESDLWQADVLQTSQIDQLLIKQICYMPPRDSDPQHVGEKTVAELVRQLDVTAFDDIVALNMREVTPTAALISGINAEVRRILDCLAVLCNGLHGGK